MKIVVYTALFGNKDALWSLFPREVDEDINYVCITEKERPQVGLWTYDYSSSRYTLVPGTSKHTQISPIKWDIRIVADKGEPRMQARYYKLHSMNLFPRADISIWVDANVRLVIHPKQAVKGWLTDGQLAAFDHPQRKDYLQEGAACIQMSKGKEVTIRNQLRVYRREGLPRNIGLASTRVVIRRHSPRIGEFNKLWWEEVSTRSIRDQISFPYVCWKTGLKWKVIPGHADLFWKSVRNPDIWFNSHGHTIN